MNQIQWLIGLWVYQLHLNHNPSNAVTLDIKTLPKVNIQTTVLLFS